MITAGSPFFTHHAFHFQFARGFRLSIQEVEVLQIVAGLFISENGSRRGAQGDAATRVNQFLDPVFQAQVRDVLYTIDVDLGKV